MSDIENKIECRLKATETDQANEKVIKDLLIPDPDPEVGKKVLSELMKEESTDDNGSKNS